MGLNLPNSLLILPFTISQRKDLPMDACDDKIDFLCKVIKYSRHPRNNQLLINYFILFYSLIHLRACLSNWLKPFSNMMLSGSCPVAFDVRKFLDISTHQALHLHCVVLMVWLKGWEIAQPGHYVIISESPSLCQLKSHNVTVSDL